MAAVPRAEPSTGALNGAFLACLLMAVLDFLFRAGLDYGQEAPLLVTVLLFTFYALLPIYLAFGPVRTDDVRSNLRNMLIFYAISVLVFFGPGIFAKLANSFPNAGALVSTSVIALILMQGWVWFIVLFFPSELRKLWRQIFGIYVILLVVALIYQNAAILNALSGGSTAITGQSSGSNIQAGASKIFRDAYSNTLQLVDKGKVAVNSSNTWLNQSVSYASGDYYTAKVDNKAKVPNKVEIKELKAVQASFKDNEGIVVFGVLSAETLDEELGDAQMTCEGRAQGQGINVPRIAATIKPEVIGIKPYESYDFTCTWPAGVFKHKGLTGVLVNATATYPFSTQAYLRTYWMDATRYRELKRDNKDPLAEYQVADRNPTTIFTQGPVKVGIGLRNTQQLYTLDRTSPEIVEQVLGITIDNLDKAGRVDSLESLAIILPRGMTLTAYSNGIAPKTSNCEDVPELRDGCDDTLSMVYVIPMNKTDIGEFLTLLFTMRITPSDYEKVLSPSPITTRYVKASVRYKFTTERAINLKVTHVEDAVVNPTQTGPVTITAAPEVTAADKTTIKYATSVPTKDKIQFYTITGTGNIAEKLEDDYATKSASINHIVTLEGLQAATTYRYKIISTSETTSTANQEESYEFTTP